MKPQKTTLTLSKRMQHYKHFPLKTKCNNLMITEGYNDWKKEKEIQWNLNNKQLTIIKKSFNLSKL